LSRLKNLSEEPEARRDDRRAVRAPSRESDGMPSEGRGCCQIRAL